MGQFCRNDFAASLEDLALAQAAGAGPSACRGQVDAVLVERGEQVGARPRRKRIFLVVVYYDPALALFHDPRFHKEEQQDKQQDNAGENA